MAQRGRKEFPGPKKGDLCWADLESSYAISVFEGVSRQAGVFHADTKYWQNQDHVLATGNFHKLWNGCIWFECLHIRHNELVWIADQDWCSFVQASTIRE